MAIIEAVTASDYIVVQKFDRIDFCNTIKNFINQNYMILGPPSIVFDGIRLQYIQAMVLEATPEP